MALILGLGMAGWDVPVRLSSPEFLEEAKQGHNDVSAKIV